MIYDAGLMRVIKNIENELIEWNNLGARMGSAGSGNWIRPWHIASADASIAAGVDDGMATLPSDIAEWEKCVIFYGIDNNMKYDIKRYVWCDNDDFVVCASNYISCD